jgi:hypothetical protein
VSTAREVVTRSIQHSLAFGLLEGKRQIVEEVRWDVDTNAVVGCR